MTASLINLKNIQVNWKNFIILFLSENVPYKTTTTGAVWREKQA
jgi:hypothetical protein